MFEWVKKLYGFDLPLVNKNEVKDHRKWTSAASGRRKVKLENYENIQEGRIKQTKKKRNGKYPSLKDSS